MRGVNDEVFLLLVWFFTGNERECNKAPSTDLTVFLIISLSPLESGSEMLVDKGRRGIGQRGIVRGRGAVLLFS